MLLQNKLGNIIHLMNNKVNNVIILGGEWYVSLCSEWSTILFQNKLDNILNPL